MLNLKSKKSLFLMLAVSLFGISTMQARPLTPDELARFNVCFDPVSVVTKMTTERLSCPGDQCSQDNWASGLLRSISDQEKRKAFRALMKELGVAVVERTF